MKQRGNSGGNDGRGFGRFGGTQGGYSGATGNFSRSYDRKIRGVMEILRREVMVMDVASTEMVLVCMVPVDLNVQRSM